MPEVFCVLPVQFSPAASRLRSRAINGKVILARLTPRQTSESRVIHKFASEKP